MLVVQRDKEIVDNLSYIHDINLISELITKLSAYQLMLNKAKRKTSKIAILEKIVVGSTTLTSVGTWTLSNLTLQQEK